jgi:hypothetical protein
LKGIITYKSLKRSLQCKFLVDPSAFSNKRISTVIIATILVTFFGHSEVYGQTMTGTTNTTGDGGVSNNSTIASDVIIECLVNDCIDPRFQLPSNTSIIAMAFVNVTLKDIQDYKNVVLKSHMSQVINDTIDKLATGLGVFDFTVCPPPVYSLELPCPMIKGIIVPPKNVTTTELND